MLCCFFFEQRAAITFYGFAENKETQINMENPIEIQNIYVTTGQRVKKGTILLDVVSSTLPVKIANSQYSIEELNSKYDQWKTDLDWKISQYKIELNEKTSAIQSEIDQYKAMLASNTILAKSIGSISLDTTEKQLKKGPIHLKIEALEEELAYAKDILNTEIKSLESRRYAENNPILSQIKIYETELEFFNSKREKQTIFAPHDGLVGNIHCKQDEKISSFSPLISFYEESPTQVVGYIHEDLLLKVNIGDSIEVLSGSRPGIKNMGVVQTLGSRIVEIPPRLRKIKELKTYGREVIIQIKPNNPFLQKEKVILNIN